MTSQELYEHVQELARDLDVAFWICLTCPGDYGEARIERAGDRTAYVTAMPDEPGMYMVALHELGHHADPDWPRGLRLDREAAAWRWALKTAATKPTPVEWALIAENLHSYARDRRYKRTEAFEALLAEAESSRTYAR